MVTIVCSFQQLYGSTDFSNTFSFFAHSLTPCSPSSLGKPRHHHRPVSQYHQDTRRIDQNARSTTVTAGVGLLRSVRCTRRRPSPADKSSEGLSWPASTSARRFGKSLARRAQSRRALPLLTRRRCDPAAALLGMARPGAADGRAVAASAARRVDHSAHC